MILTFGRERLEDHEFKVIFSYRLVKANLSCRLYRQYLVSKQQQEGVWAGWGSGEQGCEVTGQRVGEGRCSLQLS